MSTTKPPEKPVRLGGGIVLLPGFSGFPSVHTFQLLQPYSLGADAFYVEPGLINDALALLRLMRMEDIRQLQILSIRPVGRSILGGKGPHTFPHNRLIHNLRAGALHGVIGQAIGLGSEQLTIGILADCMHDNFTCAGGDSWKDVNHQTTLFDEDDSFADKIFRYYGADWNQFCFNHNYRTPGQIRQQLQEIIYGQGLHGEIHEVADTASYMLGDLEEIEAVCPDSESRILDRGRDRHLVVAPDFAEILQAAKHPWDIWNSLVEKNGHLVVTDPVALNNFLLLRVLLWKNLYQNPARKVLEMLLRNIVYPYMVSRKLIQISDLPTKGDTWLFDIVEQEMGWQKGQSSDLNLLGSFPKRKAFATWEKALAFEEKKYNSGAFTLVFSVRDFQRTNSKTDKYQVFGPDGRVDTFKAVYPKHAAVIDQIAKDSTAPALPVQVVYVEHPQVSDNLRLAWREARARWRQRVD